MQVLASRRFSLSLRSFRSSSTMVVRSLLMVLALGAGALAQVQAQTPAVGDKVPDFTLKTMTGMPVARAGQLRGGSVVLVVLRGYPGYQCPFCEKQVHDFVAHAAEFAAKKATVLLVYPGPAADLDQKAKEFLAKQAEMPANIVLVTDPDYTVTNRYGLRWDAPRETAYPSTFLLDKDGRVVFEKISHGHGDRLSAQDALDHLAGR